MCVFHQEGIHDVSFTSDPISYRPCYADTHGDGSASTLDAVGIAKLGGKNREGEWTQGKEDKHQEKNINIYITK